MYFSDDAKMLGDLLERYWDRGINSRPPINYKAEAFMVDGRTGSIYIDRLTRSNTIDSTDYSSVGRQSYLSIRVSTPANMRDVHFKSCREVIRIIEENRRAGVDRLGGWEYMEIVSERPVQDASGTFVNVFDIKLTRFHQPIRHHGFGSDVCIESVKDVMPEVPDDMGCETPPNEETEMDDSATDPGDCDDLVDEETEFSDSELDPGDCDWIENEETAFEDGVTDPGDCDMPDMHFDD